MPKKELSIVPGRVIRVFNDIYEVHCVLLRGKRKFDNIEQFDKIEQFDNPHF